MTGPGAALTLAVIVPQSATETSERSSACARHYQRPVDLAAQRTSREPARPAEPRPAAC